MNIKKFHLDVGARLHQLRGEFPAGWCYITNSAGTVHDVNVSVAARMLVEGSARLSTDQEIQARRHHDETQREALTRSEIANKNPYLGIDIVK